MAETFGYQPDEGGFINFMTVRTDFVVTNFEEYMEFFRSLVQVAELNPGVMPIYRPESNYGTDK